MKLIHAEFFPGAWPLSRDWRSMSPNPIYHLPYLTKALYFILISSFAIGCSQKRGVAENPDLQFFQDVSHHYLPSDKVSLQGATFARVDRIPGSDLIWFVSVPGDGARIKILFNEGKKGIGRNKGASKVQRVDEAIRFLAKGDISGNGTDDLILITSSSKKGSAKVLFNNGKGYFSSRPNVELPFIPESMDRVDLVDVDQDRDLDLIFTGKKVLTGNGKIDKRQGQVLINNGEGKFKNVTALLWPMLPAGIVGTSIADYDRDGLPDVFLVYGNGQNRLLMNNGVGQFVDKTNSLLPGILDKSTHADWADFDQDGDNDLLVINTTIKKRYQSYPGETCYFLENDGYGRFRKTSNRELPAESAFRVYLLDANGTGIPDAIILGRKGPHYLVGLGKWNFSVGTNKRFPETGPIKNMTFGDINGDGFLDILGVSAGKNTPKLWLNRVK